MRRLMAAAMAAMLAAPAVAGDFSAGSEAKEWGLIGERKARFEAKVVDAVCALAGDCPADCGAGLRQMALIREADGKMLLAFKNVQPIFTGATVDLAPYCGQSVTVDGLLVGDPEATGGAEIMQVQIVVPGGGEPVKTTRWTEVWAERFPEAAKQEGPWFRNDPRIRSRIAEDGYLGLGAEADRKYIEENF